MGDQHDEPPFAEMLEDYKLSDEQMTITTIPEAENIYLRLSFRAIGRRLLPASATSLPAAGRQRKEDPWALRPNPQNRIR